MLSKSSEHNYERSAKQVFDIEIAAISAMRDRLSENFTHACKILRECRGKVVVTGMGKSGHIGNKIAATLASTGTPAFFMHPGEANHGDLGMLSKDDVVLAISNSGETAEVITLLPVIKRMAIPVVSMTNNLSSSLAQNSDVVLDISVENEACSLGLAPTASTTVTLVLGDALAVALLEANGFTSDDFALSHPGGSLGRKLLLKVDDLMLRGDSIPTVRDDASISDALLTISNKGLGITAICDEKNTLLGVFTDGDLRRILDTRLDIHTTAVKNVMTADGLTVQEGEMAVNALNLMETKKVNALLVVNDKRSVVGAFNMHMLLNAGVV